MSESISFCRWQNYVSLSPEIMGRIGGIVTDADGVMLDTTTCIPQIYYRIGLENNAACPYMAFTGFRYRAFYPELNNGDAVHKLMDFPSEFTPDRFCQIKNEKIEDILATEPRYFMNLKGESFLAKYNKPVGIATSARNSHLEKYWRSDLKSLEYFDVVVSQDSDPKFSGSKSYIINEAICSLRELVPSNQFILYMDDLLENVQIADRVEGVVSMLFINDANSSLHELNHTAVELERPTAVGDWSDLRLLLS